MMGMCENIISVSIVLFENDLEEISRTIKCALKSELISCIYLIDNSPTEELSSLVKLDKLKIKYFFQNANLGFGKAHNVALEFSKCQGFRYHLILNPDVEFKPEVIRGLCSKLDSDKEIGLIMPKILNKDGSNQYLPKLLPHPANLIIRIFKPLNTLFKRANDKYILKGFENMEINVPLISGCFCIYSIDAYSTIGGYDNRFFMYYEDFDLSRRIHSKYKTLYYPLVSVVHGYERGAMKNFKLFKIFITSVIKYFNKYGWIFDFERKKINEKIISVFIKTKIK